MTNDTANNESKIQYGLFGESSNSVIYIKPERKVARDRIILVKRDPFGLVASTRVLEVRNDHRSDIFKA